MLMMLTMGPAASRSTLPVRQSFSGFADIRRKYWLTYLLIAKLCVGPFQLPVLAWWWSHTTDFCHVTSLPWQALEEELNELFLTKVSDRDWKKHMVVFGVIISYNYFQHCPIYVTIKNINTVKKIMHWQKTSKKYYCKHHKIILHWSD